MTLKRWQIISMVVLGLLLFAWFLNEFVKPRVIPKRFEVVAENALYRAGRIHPDLLPRVIAEHGIDSIVTMTYPVADHPYQIAEKQVADALGIPIYRYPLGGDGLGDPASYIGALEKVHEEISNGRQVLVHCAAGTERTGGVVYLYETLMKGKTDEEARANLLAAGHRPERNPALIPFLAEIKQDVIAALQSGGIIAAPDSDAVQSGAPQPAASAIES